MATEFQIKETYRDGSGGYLYFKVVGVRPQQDLLERMAVKKVQEEHNNATPSLYFSGEVPKPRPTITVVEYEDGKAVKGGIKFKCKWR